MILRWHYSKPEGTTDNSWRRQQITIYLDASPGCKPKDVFYWLSSHSLYSWLLYDTNYIGKMRRIQRSCYTKEGLSLFLLTLTDNFAQLPFRWDMKKPREFDIHYWRRTQLKRYLIEFPSHMNKKILD